MFAVYAAEAILGLDPDLGVEYVLPLLNDRSTTLRWCICRLLYGLRRHPRYCAADRAPAKGSTSAGSLLQLPTLLVGLPLFQAVWALLEAEQNDRELDSLGHSASSASTQVRSAIS